jgi:predicted nucleic-acid-binding Zn-ribbon protein
MNIKCTKCGHREETNLELFVKIIGGAMPVGGFFAWVTYIFAGTGFAMEICVAIIVGGVAMLVFKEQIVKFIIDKGYKCPKCGNGNWRAE